MVNVEGFHIPLLEGEAYQGVSGTLRLHLGPLAVGGSVAYSGVGLFNDFSGGNLSLFAGAGVDLGGVVLAAAMPLSYSEGTVDFTGRRLNITIGLGGVQKKSIWRFGRRFISIGGAALYYNHMGLAGFDEEGNFVFNQNPDWLNARVGIISDVRTPEGMSLLDVSFDLNFLKAQEEEEEINPLDFVDATLSFVSKALVLGASYHGKDGYLFSAGIALRNLAKVWGEFKFDKEFHYVGWGAFAQVTF